MPSVSNISIKLQTGTSNTYYATWDFTETAKKNTTNSTITTGSWVTIAPGATYYNGVSIPDWVKTDTWKVVSVWGDRAVLGQNPSGTHNIQSPINTKYLITSGSSSSTTESTEHFDHYLVKWYYQTGDGDIWFVSDENGSQTKEKQSLYNAPSNAISIKVSVKPVSETYSVNDTEVSYWNGSWVSETLVISVIPPPEDPTSAPSVTIDKYQLKATVDNIDDPRTDMVRFEVLSGEQRVSCIDVTVQNRRATYVFKVTAGNDYRVAYQAISIQGSTKVYSKWSPYSSSAGTIPNTPEGITDIKALSETSVQISWEAVKNATGYTIEYTTKKNYFDASSEVQSMTVSDATNYAIVTGLSSGEEYYFRVKATNSEGDSGWCEPQVIVIGEPPAAPTTWSSTTTAITGNPVTLFWVHNAEDRSSQSYAELELYINGNPETHTIKNSDDEDEKDKISQWSLDTTPYVEGTSIKWRVRTSGITNEYGDWSVQRTIDIYAPSTLQLSVTDANGNAIDTLSSFPFYIYALAGPKTQVPIGYHVSIKSDSQYDTVDNIGNPKIVNKGEEVFSKYYDIKEALQLEMNPSIIDLENNIQYTITCTVSMNSGLTAEASTQLFVDWNEVLYEPDLEIGINPDVYSAYISPYCIDAVGSPITDVSLSVYRREFDGSFTEIATGIDTAANEYIVDPHPSLDYARYRVVATSKTTGAVSYYDPPGYPVGANAVVIQWDDTWSNFDTGGSDDELESSPWSGSILKIPYNIDVSESNETDKSLIEYAGRSHPVTYYGTQLGVSATWSMEIPKDDKETIYALRRLARWMGDVYVREPSGSGYWASVTVTFSQKHCELTVPITLNIIQVEGGI